MENSNLTKILVVEDNLDDSFMLIRQLEKAQIDDHLSGPSASRSQRPTNSREDPARISSLIRSRHRDDQLD